MEGEPRTRRADPGLLGVPWRVSGLRASMGHDRGIFSFHQQIGRKRVAERIHALNEQCKEGLAKMRHVKLYTPRGRTLSAGLICFDVNGMPPKAVVKRLLERRIAASTTPYGTSYARLAPSLVNTPEEIETVLREIRALSTA
jgi:isopenicillin-N epimerase